MQTAVSGSPVCHIACQNKKARTLRARMLNQDMRMHTSESTRPTEKIVICSVVYAAMRHHT